MSLGYRDSNSDVIELIPSAKEYHKALQKLKESKKRHFVKQKEEVALDLFQELKERFKTTNNGEQKPDLWIYAAVLEILSQSRDIKWAEHAEILFNNMKTGENKFVPNVYCYSSVLKAHVNSGNYDHAVKLMHDWEDQSDAGLISSDIPNDVMYVIVLSGISKSKLEGDEEKQLIAHAEFLFERYKVRMSRPNYKVGRPDGARKVHGAFMNVYAKLAAQDRGGSKAERILREMYKQHDEMCSSMSSTNKKSKFVIKPNVVSFQTVIDAYCRQLEYDSSAFNDIIRLLKEIEERVQQGEKDLQENVIIGIMSTLSSIRNLPDREEKMLELLDYLRNFPNYSLKLDDQSFTIVMETLAKSGDPKWAERAEILFNNMKTGENKFVPSVYCYSSVLKAHVNSGNYDHAVKLMYDWEDQSDAGLISSDIPNGIMYVIVLSGISKSKLEGDEEKQLIAHAESLFERYKVRMSRPNYKVGHPDGAIKVHGAFMNVYAKLAAQDRGGSKAERILREMYKQHDEMCSSMSSTNKKSKFVIKPDMISFQTVIDAYCRQLEYDPNVVDDIVRLLKEIDERTQQGERDIWLNRGALGAIRKAISKVENIPNNGAAEKIFEVLENLAK